MFEVFNDIEFDEGPHKYTFTKHPHKDPTSVTTIIGRYKKSFDAEFFANRKADQLGVSKQEILDEWEMKRNYGADKGTLIHSYMEHIMQDLPFKVPNKLDREDIVRALNNTKGICDKFKTDSKDTLEHIAAEQIVGCPEWNITGMIDEVTKNKINGKYYIIDWKTNKEIKKSNPYPLLGTLSHLDSSELTVYSLQMGLYKRIIEKYTDIKIEACYICHLQVGASNYKMYKTKDVEKEIDIIIQEQMLMEELPF